ncbi:MAG: hypothetical protein QG670_2821 [Thermoproteota archaeon]|nr:hypothetical protein [Thermoproteota archaeon]
MTPESTYSFLHERNIVVLISCRIIWGLAQALFMSYFSLFALAQDGVTPEILGLIVSLKAAGTAFLSPIAGYLADAFGRKKMIFSGTAMQASCYLFYFFARDYKVILIGSIIEGLAVIHLPALSAITQDSLIKSNRGLGLSATTGLQSLPSIISPFIGGVLYANIGIDAGMRIGFAFAFVTGLTVAFIRFKFLNETLVKSPQTERGSIIRILRESYVGMFSILKEYKELRGLIILGTVDTFFTSIAAPFWVVYAKSVIGLTTVEWGTIQSLVAAVNVIVLLFSGRYVDRLGRKKIMLLNLLMSPALSISFVFCQNFYQVLLFQSFMTAQNAFVMPAGSALQADIVPREARGRAIAALGWQPIVLAVGAASSGFFKFPPYFMGSFLSGYIYNMNPNFPWYLLACGYIIEFIACYFLIREPKKSAD